MPNKIVNVPVYILAGEFCVGEDVVCEHYNNEGGHPTCDLMHMVCMKECDPYTLLRRDPDGKVRKPKWCQKLIKGEKL